MSEQKISPEKVTKPIQLLAAWLTGLILVNGAFLVTATKIGITHWSSSTLIIASILNVPLFLIAIFLLQTKFRPEMQEDLYYSKYLDKRISADTGELEENQPKIKDNLLIEELKENLNILTNRIGTLSTNISESNNRAEAEKLSILTTKITETLPNNNSNIRINDLLPSYSELYQDLIDNNIHISSTFGSSNENPRVPEVFLITCGDGIDVSVFQKVLNIGKKYGGNNVSFADDKYSEGKIYIGSYGYDLDRKQYKLDEDFIKILTKKHLTMSKLKYLLTH